MTPTRGGLVLRSAKWFANCAGLSKQWAYTLVLMKSELIRTKYELTWSKFSKQSKGARRIRYSSTGRKLPTSC